MYSHIYFVLPIIDLKMMSKKLLGPTDLSKAQILCIYKVTKIVVIYKNKYLILAIF